MNKPKQYLSFRLVARGSCLPRAPLDPDVRVDASGSPKNSFATSRRAGALRGQKGIGAYETREAHP